MKDRVEAEAELEVQDFEEFQSPGQVGFVLLEQAFVEVELVVETEVERVG